MTINPTVRLLSIIFLVLGIGLGMSWIFLRHRGLSNPISPVRSEFFNKFKDEKFAIIAYRGASADLVPNSISAFSAAAKLDPRVILWADILMTEDQQIIVTQKKTLLHEGVPTLVSFMK